MSLTDTGFNALIHLAEKTVLYNHNDIWMGACLRDYREFSPGETALFRQVVRPGMTVVEAGANIGLHTVDLARFAHGGVVHAFEPQRLPFQTLCANAALNSLVNVVAYQEAVGDTATEVSVPDLDPSVAQNFGGLALTVEYSGRSRPVTVLDDLNLPACHFIKADVEGMEWAALAGADKTIGRHRPILYVENDRREKSSELIGLIQKYRYRLYWHLPALVSLPNTPFSNVLSINMLCLPVEAATTLDHFKEITSPDDWWET